MVVAVVVLIGCATQPAIKANFAMAQKPEQLKTCDYIGSFALHFDSDGVPESLASNAERRQSNRDMRKVVAAGANTLFRVETAPAPLAKVNAYRCPFRVLAPAQS